MSVSAIIPVYCIQPFQTGRVLADSALFECVNCPICCLKSVHLLISSDSFRCLESIENDPNDRQSVAIRDEGMFFCSDCWYDLKLQV
jgi:hypothetical protein